MMNEVFKVAAPIVVLAAGILGFAAFGQKAEPRQAEQVEDAAQNVETVSVRRFDGDDDQITIDFDGVVVPFRQIRVSSEIAGRITFKSDDLRAGEYVDAETELLQIDPEFYRLEVDRLTAEKAQIVSASEELREEIANTGKLIDIAEKQLDIEAAELKRLEKLKERGVATASELTPYKRNELSAENSLAMLKKELAQLEKKLDQNEHAADVTQAKLGQAIRDQKLSSLKAPIAGLVVEDHVEEGSFVQRGTDLFLIEDISKVEISSNLTMDELGWLLQSPRLSEEGTRPNTAEAAYRLPQIPVTVSYDLAGEIYHWEGRISRLAGTGVDPKSRTIPCRVTVADPRQFQVGENSKRQTSRSPRTLMNGMFVEMTAGVVPSRPVLALPEQAVHPGNVVWKYTEQGLEVVKVEVLHRQGDEVLILAENSPLAAGDEVITSPLSNAEPGIPLQKNEETAGDLKTAGGEQ